MLKMKTRNLETSQLTDVIKLAEKNEQMCWYGEPVETGVVRAAIADESRDIQSCDIEKRVKTFRVLSYEVPDTELGLQAVAMACGYGMPNHINEHNVHYEDYVDLGLTMTKKGKLRFSKPVIALSPQTSGYRVAWGGVEEAFYGAFEVDDQEEDNATDWEHEVYVLRTNLPDGGILTQSSSSGAFIWAEKKGHVWTVSLQLPVTEDDRVCGRGYEGVFRSGFYYYCDKA